MLVRALVRCTSDSSLITTKELVWTAEPLEMHTQGSATFAEKSPKPGSPESEIRCQVAVEQDLTQRRTHSSNTRHNPRHSREWQVNPAEIPSVDKEVGWTVVNRAPARAGGRREEGDNPEETQGLLKMNRTETSLL